MSRHQRSMLLYRRRFCACWQRRPKRVLRLSLSATTKPCCALFATASCVCVTAHLRETSDLSKMTSLVAMFGMLPLALVLGSRAEMLQPLTIAVIGDLMIALLLSIIMMPTVYAMLKGHHTQRV